nr:hypothetical protein [Lachnospiraceae bacterium]
VERFNSRYGGNSNILLFTVTAGKTADEKLLNDAAASFGEVLKKTIRKSDVILQSKKNQYVVLLPSMKGLNADGVIKRVMSEWEDLPGFKDFEIKTASQIR